MPRAWNPVRVLAVDEVADDVVGRPGLGAFGAAGPEVREAAEEHVERSGCAAEEGDGVGEVEGGRGALGHSGWESRDSDSAVQNDDSKNRMRGQGGATA